MKSFYRLAYLMVLALLSNSLTAQNIWGELEVTQGTGGCENYRTPYIYEPDISPFQPPTWNWTLPWALTFSDEFDNSELDWAIWRPSWGLPASDSQNDSMYKSENVVEGDDGILHLESHRDSGTHQYPVQDSETYQVTFQEAEIEFTTGEIKTPFRFNHGAFQIRCKIPQGRGAFPAFWTFWGGANNWHEIDIFEFTTKTECYPLTGLCIYDPEKSTRTHEMTVHSDEDGESGSEWCKGSILGPDYSEQFYVLTGLWTPYHVNWYCEDVLLHSFLRFDQFSNSEIDLPFYFPWMDVGSEAGILWENQLFPNTPMEIRANLAIQDCCQENPPYGVGPLAFDPSPDVNSYDMDYEIDYIRYYQQLDCGGDVIINGTDEIMLTDDLWNVVAGETISVSNVTLGLGQHVEFLATESIDCEEGVTITGYYSSPPQLNGQEIWRGGSYDCRIESALCEASFLPSPPPSQLNNSNNDTSDEIENPLYNQKYISQAEDFRFLNPVNDVPLSKMGADQQRKLVERMQEVAKYNSIKEQPKTEKEVNPNEYKVFPIPFNEIIAIESSDKPFKKATFQVFDITGKLIHESNACNTFKHQIELSTLSSGSYTLIISTSDGNRTTKMIVK